jgi:aspartate kinase
MLTKVLKFGGSSLANGGQFCKVKEIINSQPSRKYIIASAPGKRFPEDEKVTDMLYHCQKLASQGKPIDEYFRRIAERYDGIIKELQLDLSLAQELEEIKSNIQAGAGADFAASRGEYLNSIILARYLGFDFIDAKDCIFFNEKGTLDTDRTYSKASELLKSHERAVIPGFYGSMPDGSIKTFSRGGSDITGSIIARSLNADIYENWTDVSGMLMADPRCVDNPNVIDMITYSELRELAYMGATVMHDEAIFPVRQARIPINIRNTNSPDDPGTMIVSYALSGSRKNVVTGIAGRVGFSTLYIEKDMMNSEYGFGRRVLEVLENHKLSFEHLPTGIDTMSVIINTNELNPVKESVISSIYEAVNADSVTVQDGLALIAVVGREMVNAKGTASRIFTAIAKSDVNIKLIDQGSSEMNIIVGVDDKDYITTLNAIYSEFVR